MYCHCQFSSVPISSEDKNHFVTVDRYYMLSPAYQAHFFVFCYTVLSRMASCSLVLVILCSVNKAHIVTTTTTTTCTTTTTTTTFNSLVCLLSSGKQCCLEVFVYIIKSWPQEDTHISKSSVFLAVVLIKNYDSDCS